MNRPIKMVNPLNGAETIIDIGDISNYKQCSFKQHELWVCIPSANVAVVNRLVQLSTLQLLKGRTYLLPSELVEQSDTVETALLDPQYGVESHSMKANTAIVYGVQGELSVVPLRFLQAYYSFVDKDTTVPVTTLAIEQRTKSGGMEWQKIRYTAKDTACWAYFVPSYLGTASIEQNIMSTCVLGTLNAGQIDHGEGDFIVASDAGGKPNLSTIQIVNGLVFAGIFNKKGWGSAVTKNECVSSAPKPKFSLCTPANSIEQFAVAFSTIGVSPLAIMHSVLQSNSKVGIPGGMALSKAQIEQWVTAYMDKVQTLTKGKDWFKVMQVYAANVQQLLCGIQSAIVQQGWTNQVSLQLGQEPLINWYNALAGDKQTALISCMSLEIPWKVIVDGKEHRGRIKNTLFIDTTNNVEEFTATTDVFKKIITLNSGINAIIQLMAGETPDFRAALQALIAKDVRKIVAAL